MSTAHPGIDAIIPLALLEAMRNLDTPIDDGLAELDAELVSKRLGLSTTVASQIERYRQAADKRLPVALDEAVSVFRLVSRRADAELVFSDAGRRAARYAGRHVAATEQAFLEYLDAAGAVAFIASGMVDRYADRDLAAWKRVLGERRGLLDADLAAIAPGRLEVADALAVQAMRRSLDLLDSDDSTDGDRERACSDAERRDLDGTALRAALVSCYAEHGERRRYEGGTIDRGTALQLLHVVEEPARRKALFDAFVPLWTALNGHNEPDSPYRRMIAMAAADAARDGSEIDAAARAIGALTVDVERWLVQVLDLAGREPAAAGRAVGLSLPQQRGQPAAGDEDPGGVAPAGERALLSRARRGPRQARRAVRPCAAPGQVAARLHGLPGTRQAPGRREAAPGRTRGRHVISVWSHSLVRVAVVKRGWQSK